MEHQDKWVHFSEIDWNDHKFNRFNIDTRDFHCSYQFSEKNHKDYTTLSKYNHFFFNVDELKALINRLYDESDKDASWRMLTLISNDERVLNWNLKYIRIYREDNKFIVCNKDNQAIPKHILDSPIDREFLCSQ